MSGMSRRRFIVHSAHKTIGVSAGLAALEAGDFAASLAAADEDQRLLRVCLVSGSLEYDSDTSLAAFQQHLEKQHRVTCSRAFRKTDDNLPGLENLDHCDCAIFFTRRLTVSGEPLERIKRYCRRGRAIVGVRTASHGFQNWLAMDREVFGGDYQGHYGNASKPEVKIVDAAKEHPILKGVTPFTSGGSLYKNPKIAADTTALLSGAIPGHTEPVAWTRLSQKGRVFYTSLGHRDDFREPSFLRILVNAIFWSARASGS